LWNVDGKQLIINKWRTNNYCVHLPIPKNIMILYKK
jgi:hypothetical protein